MRRIIYRLKKSDLDISTLLISALLVQASILFIYRVNLDYIGREVYYSDAEVYWEHTKMLLSGEKIIGYGTQVGYAYFCAAIQFLSPFQSVVWNNISNILLVDLSILIIQLIFIQTGVNKYNIKAFSVICLFNPLIVYSLTRNLKDALFLFITVVIIYLYMQIKLKKKWVCIVPIVILAVTISTIRPWGFLVMPLLAIDGFLSSELGSPFKRIIIALGIGSMFIVMLKSTSLWKHVVLWEPIVLEQAEQLSPIEIIKAPIKILTGPGPYRALLGNHYFLFTTDTGNFFSAVGALAWWIVLSAYLSNLIKFKIKAGNFTFALICILFIIIYSMQYGGSLELRFRGVIYILFSAAYINGLTKKLVINKDTVIIFVMILPIGTILSS